MSDSARLLQLLEPAVRPVAAPSAVRPPSRLPFEQRPFDELLAEFDMGKKATHASPDAAAGTPVADETEARPRPSTPPPFADFGRVENASLRALIAQHRPAAAQDRPAPGSLAPGSPAPGTLAPGSEAA